MTVNRVFIFFFLLYSLNNVYAQTGSLKHVIIKYDTTYEVNNMHKQSDFSEAFVDKGLKLYVIDGPFEVIQIIEKADGIENGLYILFYLTTNLPKEKGRFIQGKKDGLWYYWNKEGILTKREVWKKGKLLKSIKL